jgi:tRNA pseudouridine38-40 synthase
MANILLIISFNGSAYHGFQVQKNAVSICSVLQNALAAVFGTAPNVKGCSRTDSGVHAKEYALSFKADVKMPLEKLPMAINSFLPCDIRVNSAKQVDEDFHARYSAVGKEYNYVLLNSHIDDVFNMGQYLRVHGNINVENMQKACNFFVGSHNFAAFMSSGSDVKSTVRCIKYLNCVQNRQWITISIAADGFLYNMVRIISGTLLAVGKGRFLYTDIPKIIASENRANAAETLPAKGLFLTKVFYPKYC